MSAWKPSRGSYEIGLMLAPRVAAAIEAAAKVRYERGDGASTEGWEKAPAFVQAAYRETARLELAAAYAAKGQPIVVIGVALVGRPVARMLDDGWTAEVIRVAVLEGHRNACSRLYSAAKRAAQALGYRRVLTYTLASEPGSSLRAAGWTPKGLRGGGTWNRPSRPRVDTAPLEQKQLWEAPVVSGRLAEGT